MVVYKCVPTLQNNCISRVIDCINPVRWFFFHLISAITNSHIIVVSITLVTVGRIFCLDVKQKHYRQQETSYAIGIPLHAFACGGYEYIQCTIS